jgi:hypothetical protein
MKIGVGEYVEQLWGIEGDADRKLARLGELGVFDPPPRRIVEIGPGTGRYMERILARSRPESY